MIGDKASLQVYGGGSSQFASAVLRSFYSKKGGFISAVLLWLRLR